MRSSCCIFFDLKKAFDSVPHSVLLQKLSAIGVDPYIIQWICNYLTCRSQYVVVDGEQSCMLPVVSGVPRGSVLGPLLFLVFINEVVDQVPMDSFMSLFADDIALYRCIKSPIDYWRLQLDISALVNWVCNNFLSLQPSKCCYMLITRKKTCSIPPPILYIFRISTSACPKCQISWCPTEFRSFMVSTHIQPVCQSQKTCWPTLSSILSTC